MANFKESNVITSVEQAEQLLELEFNPNKASMIWAKTNAGDDWKPYCIPYESTLKDLSYAYRPAWAMCDLISMFPPYINYNHKSWNLAIGSNSIAYVDPIDHNYIYVEKILPNEGDTLINVAVRLLIKLKHILNKKVWTVSKNPT